MKVALRIPGKTKIIDISGVKRFPLMGELIIDDDGKEYRIIQIATSVKPVKDSEGNEAYLVYLAQ